MADANKYRIKVERLITSKKEGEDAGADRWAPMYEQVVDDLDFTDLVKVANKIKDPKPTKTLTKKANPESGSGGGSTAGQITTNQDKNGTGN